MRRPAMHLLGLSFILTACSPGNEPAADTTETHTAFWEISDTAIGPVHGGLPLTVEAAEEALPGYSTRLEQRSIEGEVYDVIVLSETSAEPPIVELSADWQSSGIGDVKIYQAGRVAGLRADIGETFSNSGFSAIDCYPGMEEMSGRVVCTDESHSNFDYWFDPSPYDGPDGELPPATVLNDARVFMLRWTTGPD